ncbi:Xylulose kinase [Nymphon striatum]|nr:Xylulose kinase [Nymphon striatum]
MCPVCTNVWVRDLGNYRYPVEKIGKCPTQYGKEDPRRAIDVSLNPRIQERGMELDISSLQYLILSRKERMYLGLDFSTQQAKAIIINDNLAVLQEVAVQYDSDLPEYSLGGVYGDTELPISQYPHIGLAGLVQRHTEHDIWYQFDVSAGEKNIGWCHQDTDGVTVTVPTIMWVKALDILLEKLKMTGIDFTSIVSVSGTGQQHGSVYWNKNAHKTLQNLDPDKFLHHQFQGCFSIRNSPVWMDSSTTKQCRALEHSLGGAQTLTDITGSSAFERFTGNQIAKLHETMLDAYNKTERISLVSSFVASLFLGDYAPIDMSDGSGMNLLNIHTKNWSEECLNGCAPDLRLKLGEVVPSSSIIGDISPYFVERYGFPEDCDVIAFTGDNPSSLAGMRLQEGDIAVSLGTSDTLFVWIREPHPSVEGHIFINPVDESQYMGLLCFKNGSLTRERIRDDIAEGSWDLFNELLNATPRGNFGNIGLYYDSPEIIPARVVGDYTFNKINERVSSYSKEVEVRAVVEGQFLRTEVLEFMVYMCLGADSKVLVTGGASQNTALIQVLSDIFNCCVYSLEVVNSACLGSAYRAKHGLLQCAAGDQISFAEIVQDAPNYRLVAEPNKDAVEVSMNS